MFSGGPGSGRGAYCEKIAEKNPGWVHISVGEILRQEIKNNADSEEWKNMGGTLQQGGLVSDVSIA